MPIKVFLVPQYIEREELEKLLNHNIDASVEAEYGNKVIEGRTITLAHHTEKYEDCHAPCNTQNIKPLKEDSIIVISHIDLDTIGGVLALMGIKPKDDDFWKSAEFIDVNGPQYLYTIDKTISNQIEAYYYLKSIESKDKITEITDVTDEILNLSKIIKKIVNKDKELLKLGEQYQLDISNQQEACLIRETKYLRIFIIPPEKNIFCNSAYYSFKEKTMKKSCIVFNKKNKNITISFADGGKELSARDIVQELWGEEAGGHKGIAGSPRGKEMTENDFLDIINFVEKEYNILNK